MLTILVKYKMKWKTTSNYLLSNELVVEENGDSDSDDEVILNRVCNRKQK